MATSRFRQMYFWVNKTRASAANCESQLVLAATGSNTGHNTRLDTRRDTPSNTLQDTFNTHTETTGIQAYGQ